MNKRREVRVLVLQALHAREVNENEKDHVFNYIVKPRFSSNKKNYRFAEKLYYKTLDEQNMLDGIIKEHIKNWRIERLATFDKVSLRMALCEFLFFDEIPTKVTMNEAIEIVKDYSTIKSGKFVNGILDSALARLNEEGRIEKSGRGLIESSVKS